MGVAAAVTKENRTMKRYTPDNICYAALICLWLSVLIFAAR